MKRYYIVFSGRVQGVGFRYILTMLAKQLKVTGFVKNLSNGSVEAQAQGDNLDEFINKVLEPKGFIQIDDYSIKEIDIVPDEKDFRVIY